MRILALTGLVVALGAGAYGFAMSTQPKAAKSGFIQSETQSAEQALSASMIQTARSKLEEYRASAGTYVGATLDAGIGVTIVRADAASYCIQTGPPATEIQHLNGPDGSPEPGPC